MLRHCPACAAETLCVSETEYDGFRKVGLRWVCTACGTALPPASAAAAPRPDPLAALFGEDREEQAPALFDVEAETGRLCRKCVHYVVHPFTQRCGLHGREVSATDTCPDFTKTVT